MVSSTGTVSPVRVPGGVITGAAPLPVEAQTTSASTSGLFFTFLIWRDVSVSLMPYASSIISWTPNLPAVLEELGLPREISVAGGHRDDRPRGAR